MMSKRVFLGISLSPSVQNMLSVYLNAFKQTCNALRFVPKRNLHITLHFIGALEVSQVSELLQSLPNIVKEMQVFDLEIGSIGCFYTDGNPKIFWLDVVAPELLEIHTVTKRWLKEHQHKVDERPYRPHITWARVRSQKAITPKMLDSILATGHLPLKVAVDAITLFESRLGKEAPLYIQLGQAPLKPF